MQSEKRSIIEMKFIMLDTKEIMHYYTKEEQHRDQSMKLSEVLMLIKVRNSIGIES